MVRSTFESLKNYDVENHLVVAKSKSQNSGKFDQDKLHYIDQNRDQIYKIIQQGKAELIKNTIIVSHGNWKFPSRLGHRLKKQGWPWIAYPHGMLEPWSMQHKRWKKQLYFHLFENRFLKKADRVVAVGRPEWENLKRQYKNSVLIPNGIAPFEGDIKKDNKKRIFLFLGRLHSKKCPFELASGWIGSSLKNQSSCRLVIAGPDEGEQNRIESLISASGTKNIELAGPVYGEEKQKLLESAHFFLLPSQSEGFPTSILESMTFACVPVFSEGCNFPEAFEKKVAVEVKSDANSIKNTLEEIVTWPNEVLETVGNSAKNFVDQNYSLEHIARLQYDLYTQVLSQQINK